MLQPKQSLGEPHSNPEKHTKKLRGVGNSSGDETGSGSMKYGKFIADKLIAAGRAWEYRSRGWSVDCRRAGKTDNITLFFLTNS